MKKTYTTTISEKKISIKIPNKFILAIMISTALMFYATYLFISIKADRIEKKQDVIIELLNETKKL